MKKLRFIVCIVLIAVVTTITFAAAADDVNIKNTDYNLEEINLLTSLGVPIADADMQDETITKSEFVAYAVWLLGYQGEKYDVTLPYSDVYRGHEYSSQLGFAYSMGMFEDKWKKLYPDDQLTKYFAETVMFNALGYQAISSASSAKKARSKIISGINTIGQTVLNRQNALKLLYNCIDIPIAEESAYIGANIDYTVSDTTLIQKYLDITKVSGRVTRTPLASITGSRCTNGHIAVDGVDYTYDGDTDSIFALYVDVYVRNIGSKDDIVAIVKNKNTGAKIIDAEDFISYSNGNVKYYENGLKSKTLSVPSPVIVYNGSDISGKDYSKSLFDIKCGTVTLVANKSGVYDVIKIDSYANMFIGAVDADKKYIYSEGGSKVSYADLENGGFYRYTAETLESINAEDVCRGMFATVRQSIDGKYIDMYVTSNCVTSAVSSIKYNSGMMEKLTLGDGSVYNVSRNVCIDKTTVNTNDTYDFYINIFGEIGGIKKSRTSTELYGYIVSSAEGSLSKSPRLKMITAASNDSNGEQILELSDNVTVDGKKIAAEDVKKAIETTNGKLSVPAIYKLNSSGKIIFLDTPYRNTASESENTLTQRSFSPKFDKYIQVARPKGYKNLLGQHYYVPENGLVVITPDNTSDIRRMSYIPSKAVSAGSGYNSEDIKLYSIGNTTALCPIVVWADNQSDEESTDYEKELYIVEDIRTELNLDEEEAMCVSLMLGNKSTEYFVSTRTNVLAAAELRIGDIVRASFDAYGEIDGMEIMFSSESPDKYVGKVYVHNTKGDAGAQITLMAHEFRVAVGKVKSVEYDQTSQKYYITYFLSDLSDIECTPYITTARKCVRGRNGIEISEADAANIKAYDDVGDEADIIVVRYQFCVPITEYIVS